MGAGEAVPATLAERVQGFLPALRLGIDFGEHTGGIALVRANTIVHAETFLDFHEATLLDRRQLRRGRRTRHAKRMRLARLRSWVLRQKLPDGTRLPDPYPLMRDPRYMVPPGIYGTKAAEPKAAPSWIELAKRGQVTPAGFVRALTLIFQKRGYSWDERTPADMTDQELKDFLQSARIPPEGSLDELILAEIQRREENPDDPARGRKDKRVPSEELRRLLALACQRQPQPRVAEHRRVKEAELEAVVAGFARAIHLPQPETTRWQRELTRLLNKRLRLPRFENRLKSGCAWCGKATPRKAKVRELAYFAAIHNLRVQKFPQPIRALSEEELSTFKQWWANREEGAPGAETIRRHLAKLHAQKEMAHQLHDLLKNLKPKGRASLCRQHLEVAAQGKTMKDAGIEPQTIAPRKTPNPCRELRDWRILHRLEQLLFKPGHKGAAAWRFGPVHYITLEIPEPATERAPKGMRKKREEETFKDRLLEEFQGKCAYEILGNCQGEIETDHIFPHARGGPDLRVNLVPACKAHNDEKGDRTPFEWLAADPARWQRFQHHVLSLPINTRKKHILLNDTPDYPEADPTPFARIGARPRQFIVALRKLFASYGVTPPRTDYRLGEPLVQRIPGGLTFRLRLSWLKKPDGSDNFPPKDPASLFSHAQDAALLAACPPHTWRERIFCYRARRPDRLGTWVERPGLAPPELAPDWAEFFARREFPIVRVLGRYPITWHRSFADLTFGRQPLELKAPKLKQSILVKDLKVGQLQNVVSAYWRSRLLDLARELGLPENKTFPEAVLAENFPGLRRLQLWRQPGGILVQLRPHDGPVRKVQVKLPSEGVVIWQQEVGKKTKRLQVKLSLIRPRALLRLGLPRLDPPIPPAAHRLGTLKRHQIIWLDATEKHPAGFYRLTKFQHIGITAMPESAVPQEIIRRLKMKLPPKEEAEEEERNRITLGRAELARYFRTLQPDREENT